MGDSDSSAIMFAPSSDEEDFLPSPKPKAAKKKTTTKPVAPAKTTKPKPAAKTGKAPLAPSRENSANLDHDALAPLSKSSKTQGNSETKTVEEIYQKKTQLEHILLRPDTYIGSVEALQTPLWVYENNQVVYRNTTYVPGLFKIFDEILVNAADNKQRDPSMDTLRVTIDRENNLIEVYNNGRGIPVEMHKEEGVYVPELIFGHLLTSSNYNDDQKKVVGGRNGYGAKLCNIFSTEFIVETADKVSGYKYKQVFRNNMSTKSEPKITPNTKKEEFTKITFKPDFAKFDMTEIDDDLEALLSKRVYDMAGVVKDVKVFLNGERVKVRNFKQYVEMYINQATGSSEVTAPKPPLLHEIVNDRWEVCFTLSEGQFQQVSFVNSICTSKGGTHVAYVADQIVTKLVEAVKKKNKAAPVKPFQVKNHLWVFVNCLIENPTFDSQTKENMTLRASAFGSKCSISDDFIKKVLKSGVVENILNWAKFKQDQLLKKTDGHKRSRITGITKLEDANNAGTRNGSRCTLILTEGDSAKALAVSGLSVVGRDNYGVFPLRGKLLNVREASASQIMANQEIQYIKQILGLQHNKAYTSTEALRYGHLMIMTDQDHDGSHIKGLIINFLDHFYPSLLKVPEFLVEFITPIVRCKKDKKEVNFFTIPEYETWKEENADGKGWTIKYYKGLGTSTAADAKNYFSAMDKHRKPFAPTEEGDRELIDMAFNKKKADDRKEWLRQCRPGTFMDHSVDRIRYSDFINRELILFSMADNARSIPSVIDGLKPGQRKVLFGCFKRNLRSEMKVAQLAGYVSEHSAYHHGEVSLTSTIVNLAQSFVGANNINLLEPLGQFGTRLQGGKDAASARYIYTNISPLTRRMYNASDEPLLKYLVDDGQNIEPEWYMPIIPMVLVNGADGIGTGWSTHIPNYNPADIVTVMRQMMKGEETKRIYPWYRGFTGQIELESKDKFRLTGTIRKIDSTTVEITELPIRCWTQSYKEQLETWLTGSEKSNDKDKDPKKDKVPFIKDYKEYHTDTTVHFLVTLSEENLRQAEAEGLEKKFKLSTTITLTNMVCFDSEGRIKRYTSPEEMIEEFYPLRLSYYQRRKDHMAARLTTDWTRLDNRVRFVREIIAGEIKVHNRKRVDLLAELRARGYVAMDASGVEKNAEEDGDEREEQKGKAGYDYLLGMAIWSLTREKAEALEKERDKKEAELKALLELSAKDLWSTDLDAFMEDWEATLEADKEVNQPKKIGAQSKTQARKPTAARGKKPTIHIDDDSSENDDDDGDVYEESSKPTKRSTAPKKTAPTSRKDAVVKNESNMQVDEQPIVKPKAGVSGNTKKGKSVETDKYDLHDSSDSEPAPLSDRIEQIRLQNASNTGDSSKPPTQKQARSRSPIAKSKAIEEGTDSPAHKKAFVIDSLASEVSQLNIVDGGKGKKVSTLTDKLMKAAPKGRAKAIPKVTKIDDEKDNEPENSAVGQGTKKKVAAVKSSRAPRTKKVTATKETIPDEEGNESRNSPIENDLSMETNTMDTAELDKSMESDQSPVAKPRKGAKKVSTTAASKKKASKIVESDSDDVFQIEEEVSDTPVYTKARPARGARTVASKKPIYVEISDGEDESG